MLAVESPFALSDAEASAAGLWVFPIKFKPKGDGRFDKVGLVPWKKHQIEKPTDAERADWRLRFPWAGGAVPCGTGTGVVIIDGDGQAAIDWLLSRGMPWTWMVASRRGYHWWFKHPKGFEVRNSESALHAHVDVRGMGGMAVFVHSRYCVDGGVFTYRWVEGHSTRDGRLAELPDWLHAELRERAERLSVTPAVEAKVYAGELNAWRRKALEANLEMVRNAREGQKNRALFDSARRLGQLVAGGELPREVVGLLHEIAKAWGNYKHSAATIERAFKMGLDLPKRCVAKD